MTQKPAPFPGFTALNKHIFVREGEKVLEGGRPSQNHPRVVIVFGWGDAVPKHVAKFTDGYRTLFPHAKQIAVLAPIVKATTDNLKQRADSMKLVVEAAYGSYSPMDGAEDAVLMHGMSNTGAINCASTLKAYQQRYGKPMPHRLAVWDSAPGSPYMTWATLKRWANATAMGVAPHLPLPFVATQCLTGVFLAVHRGIQVAGGREPAPVFSYKALNDPTYMPKSCRRLHLYSRDDRIVASHEIEETIAIGKAAAGGLRGRRCHVRRERPRRPHAHVSGQVLGRY